LRIVDKRVDSAATIAALNEVEFRFKDYVQVGQFMDTNRKLEARISFIERDQKEKIGTKELYETELELKGLINTLKHETVPSADFKDKHDEITSNFAQLFKENSQRIAETNNHNKQL
jgi:hypothetical protein